MTVVRRVLWRAWVVLACVWALVFGLFGFGVLLVAPPVGLLALGLAAMPLMTIGLRWMTADLSLASREPGAGSSLTPGPPAAGYGAVMLDPYRFTRPMLEGGLVTALDLATPMAGPGRRGPWMPIDVTSTSPPAIRPIQPDGEIVPMIVEAGVVLAGPGPSQAVRHMIAAYPLGVAESVLSAAHGNHLGAFGDDVAIMERRPDAYPVGEVRTTMRIVAVTGLVSHVVVWRRGPLVAHLSVSGDELLAGILLGHATQVADLRLRHLLLG
jgi:hypothetical protein